MNHYAKWFLLGLLVWNQGFALTTLRSSYWQCTTQDSEAKEWSVTNDYQKVALNLAFAACKKESRVPTSCKALRANCEGFHQENSTRPMWRCTALDYTAAAWQGSFHADRDEAALAAKASCKENSTVPDTCYINLVTCMNYLAGESL